MEKGESVKSIVAQIMTDFARSTGLSPVDNDPTRYLWTDAFGVCNFLGLYEGTEDPNTRNSPLSSWNKRITCSGVTGKMTVEPAG